MITTRHGQNGWPLFSRVTVDLTIRPRPPNFEMRDGMPSEPGWSRKLSANIRLPCAARNVTRRVARAVLIPLIVTTEPAISGADAENQKHAYTVLSRRYLASTTAGD
jgi:hypothetical protein